MTPFTIFGPLQERKNRRKRLDNYYFLALTTIWRNQIKLIALLESAYAYVRIASFWARRKKRITVLYSRHSMWEYSYEWEWAFSALVMFFCQVTTQHLFAYTIRDKRTSTAMPAHLMIFICLFGNLCEKFRTHVENICAFGIRRTMETYFFLNKIQAGTNINIKRSCSINYCDDFDARKFTLIPFRAKDAGYYQTHTHTRARARTMGHEWQPAALTQFAQPNYGNISFWLPSGRTGYGNFSSAARLRLN